MANTSSNENPNENSNDDGPGGQPRLARGAMPMPRVTGIPKFDGKHVEEWLEQYNGVANDWGVQTEGKVNGLIWYLSREEPQNIYDFVKRLASYKSRNWTAIEEDLRDAFPDEDEQERYTVSDLRELTRREAQHELTSLTDLTDYRVRFERVAAWLKDHKLINDDEMADEFYSGLPRHIRELLMVEARITSRARETAGGAGGSGTASMVVTPQ